MIFKKNKKRNKKDNIEKVKLEFDSGINVDENGELIKKEGLPLDKTKIGKRGNNGKQLTLYEKISRKATNFLNPCFTLANIMVSEEQIGYVYIYSPLPHGAVDDDGANKENASIVEEVLNVSAAAGCALDWNFIAQKTDLTQEGLRLYKHIEEFHKDKEKQRLYKSQLQHFLEERTDLSDGYGVLIFVENRELLEGKKGFKKRDPYQVATATETMTQEEMNQLIPYLMEKHLFICERLNNIIGFSFEVPSKDFVEKLLIRQEIPSINAFNIASDGYFVIEQTKTPNIMKVIMNKNNGYDDEDIIEESFFTYFVLEDIDPNFLKSPNPFFPELILSSGQNINIFISSETEKSEKMLLLQDEHDAALQKKADYIYEAQLRGEEISDEQEDTLKMAELGEEFKQEILESELTVRSTVLVRIENDTFSGIQEDIKHFKKQSETCGYSFNQGNHIQYKLHQNVASLRENTIKYLQINTAEQFSNQNFLVGEFLGDNRGTPLFETYRRKRMVFLYNRNQIESDDSIYKTPVDSTTSLIFGGTGSGKTYLASMIKNVHYRFEGRPQLTITRKADDILFLKNNPELKDDFAFINFDKGSSDMVGTFDPFILGLSITDAFSECLTDYEAIITTHQTSSHKGNQYFIEAFELLFYDIYKRSDSKYKKNTSSKDKNDRFKINHKGRRNDKGLYLSSTYDDFLERFDITEEEHANISIFGFKKLTFSNILVVQQEEIGKNEKEAAIEAINILTNKNNVIANTLFGTDESVQVFDLKKNYIIINLNGIDAPSSSEKNIMDVVSSRILSKIDKLMWKWLAMRGDLIKDVTFDEVAALLEYEQLASSIDRNNRLFRSSNSFLYLITQSVGDIAENKKLKRVLTQTATFFVAPPRSRNSQQEFELIKKYLHLPKSELRELEKFSQRVRINPTGKRDTEGKMIEEAELFDEGNQSKKIYPFAYKDSNNLYGIIETLKLSESMHEAYRRR